MVKIIPAKFDFATPFQNGWSLVCQSCNIILSVPQSFDDTNGQWGLVDQIGTLWADGWGEFEPAMAIFQNLTSDTQRAFKNNLNHPYLVKANGAPYDPEKDEGLTGFKNKDGSWIMPPQLDNHYGLWEKPKLIYVPPYLVDLRGERRLRPHLQDIYKDDLDHALIRFWADEKIGYADFNLNIKIAPQFDGAWPFQDGTAIVCVGCVDVPIGEYNTSEGGSWGIISPEGDYIIPLTPTNFADMEKKQKALIEASSHN